MYQWMQAVQSGVISRGTVSSHALKGQQQQSEEQGGNQQFTAANTCSAAVYH